MATTNIKKQDNFNTHFKTFKALLKGSKMAKASSLGLITISLILVYKSRADLWILTALVAGVLILGVYIIRFLSLANIKQKSYTQMSLVSSISKFKSYMKYRKKYEMYFLGFWVISLIPYASSSLESRSKAVLYAIAYIALVSVLGNLAFNKVDKKILDLEREMQSELDN